jgi:hypothetical protein
VFRVRVKKGGWVWPPTGAFRVASAVNNSYPSHVVGFIAVADQVIAAASGDQGEWGWTTGIRVSAVAWPTFQGSASNLLGEVGQG